MASRSTGLDERPCSSRAATLRGPRWRLLPPRYQCELPPDTLAVSRSRSTTLTRFLCVRCGAVVTSEQRLSRQRLANRQSTRTMPSTTTCGTNASTASAGTSSPVVPRFVREPDRRVALTHSLKLLVVVVVLVHAATQSRGDCSQSSQVSRLTATASIAHSIPRRAARTTALRWLQARYHLATIARGARDARERPAAIRVRHARVGHSAGVLLSRQRRVRR